MLIFFVFIIIWNQFIFDALNYFNHRFPKIQFTGKAKKLIFLRDSRELDVGSLYLDQKF